MDGLIGSGKWTVCLAAAMLLSAGAAWAAPINYGNRSGDTVDFFDITEDSGTDLPPLYGAPTVTDDTLIFEPTAEFSSNSPENGQTSDTTDGLLRFTITAKPGFFITEITLREFGDYSLLAAPGGFAAAAINGSLFGTDTQSGMTEAVSYVGRRDNPPTNEPSPFVAIGFESEQDAWFVTTGLDYQGQQLQEVEIDLNNTLQTVIAPDAAAFIAKKGVEIEVTTQLIPEPGTLALMGLGVACMIGRRRRER